MNSQNTENSQNTDCACAENRAAIEARFHRAKQALTQAQEQHCQAACEFLAARAEARHILEAAFPEPQTRQAQRTYFNSDQLQF